MIRGSRDTRLAKVDRDMAQIIACIEDPVVIEKILTHLDAQASAPKAAIRPPCRAPPARAVRLIGMSQPQ